MKRNVGICVDCDNAARVVTKGPLDKIANVAYFCKLLPINRPLENISECSEYEPSACNKIAADDVIADGLGNEGQKDV